MEFLMDISWHISALGLAQSSFDRRHRRFHGRERLNYATLGDAPKEVAAAFTWRHIYA
jgi:hypothetical protein